jgi:hypothetical protein
MNSKDLCRNASQCSGDSYAKVVARTVVIRIERRSDVIVKAESFGRPRRTRMIQYRQTRFAAGSHQITV